MSPCLENHCACEPAHSGRRSFYTLQDFMDFFGSLFYLWNKMDFVPSVEMFSETKATPQELIGTSEVKDPVLHSTAAKH